MSDLALAQTLLSFRASNPNEASPSHENSMIKVEDGAAGDQDLRKSEMIPSPKASKYHLTDKVYVAFNPKKRYYNEIDMTKARKSSTFQSSNKRFAMNHNSDDTSRMSFCTKLPIYITEFVNSGDEESIKQLIQEAFLPDCKMKTSALARDLVGRQYVQDFLLALIQDFPDFIMVALRPEVNARVVTTYLSCYGTRVKSSPYQYLYDHLKFGRDESGTFVKQSYDYRSLLKEGKPIGFKQDTVMHLIMNKELTHVEKFVTQRRLVNVFEYNEG